MEEGTSALLSVYGLEQSPSGTLKETGKAGGEEEWPRLTGRGEGGDWEPSAQHREVLPKGTVRKACPTSQGIERLPGIPGASFSVPTGKPQRRQLK